MKIDYTFSDLQQEMEGMRVGRMSFSGALKRSLGDKEAVQWYYRTKIPTLKNKTPHEYAKEREQKGREKIASELYYLLTGQPD